MLDLPWAIPFFFFGLFSFILGFNITIFYLDGFRLAENKFIRFSQIFSFLFSLPIFWVLFVNFFTFYELTFWLDGDKNTSNTVKDTNNDINLHGHGHVTIDKDGAKALGQGLSTIGSQIGLGATMVGVSGAVSKAVAKSSLPLLQKAGVIIGSGLVAGLGHSMISTLNRNTITAESTVSTSATTATTNTSTTTPTDVSSYINKLIDDSQSSPLQDLLFQLEAMDYVCLSLIYILIIQLVFKIYFKDKIYLNISKLLGNNINMKIEFYLNKIIILNKKISIIWIWFIITTLLFGLSISAYTLHNICINMDSFIDVHNLLNCNFLNNNNNIYVPNKSIKEILLTLEIINFVSIFIIIYLIIQIILKWNFNKNVNNIYLWLALIILILTLAFSAYTYDDLYTKINIYVDIYINLRNK